VLIALFVLLIVPAPVPASPEFLAPAFAVAIFEWIFQDNGRPEVAFRILGIGLVAGVLLSVLAWFIQRLMRQRRQAS
jgi:ABC-type enterochelin transport system permease subunit